MKLIRCLACSLLLIHLLISSVNGQQCTGSLGDPIVNITFGAGGNFGKPLPAGVTSNLQYVASVCPNDGYYSITNSTSGCFGNAWLTTKDHTGDPNGYFMLINASYEPSNFFIQKIDGLCPGTTYEFAAWLLNVLYNNGILPDITFSIETVTGDTLGLYNTGQIPVDRAGNWKQYGFNFTTPSDISTIVLRMRNNAPGGNGNDLGLDDITFRPAGPSISVGIQGHPDNELVVCPGSPDIFTFNSTIDPCYVSAAYQWQLSRDTGRNWINIPGETSASFQRKPTSSPGIYLYRLAVAQTGNIGISNCRVVSANIKITVPPTPAPDLGPPAFLCKDDSLLLSPGNFDSYRWQDGSVLPTFLVKKGGNYSVTVSNACESVSTSVFIQERVCGFFFPTAFTPNNDGINETFKILSSYSLSTYDLRVFNRWGQLVFHTNDFRNGWDGTINGQAAASGLYVWKCEMTVAGSNQTVYKNGRVNLIR